MKLFLVVALSLFSTAAMADGFRCQGRDFRVKVFNQVHPDLGTRNPAFLVVSERGVGTVVTLKGKKIEKTINTDTITYEGQNNGTQDGRFIYVSLQVSKSAETSGVFAGQHLAKFRINADRESRVAMLACERYRKHFRE